MVVEKRSGDARDPCEIDATIRVPHQSTAIPCVVADISEAGARLQIDPALDLTQQFTLALPLTTDHEDQRVVEIRWREGPDVGVRFLGRPTSD